MATDSDNFNRANGGLGSNWISSPDLSPAGHQPQISSNAVVDQVPGEHEAAYWSDAVNTFANDQFAQVTVGAQGGPIVRHQIGSSSFYLLFGDVPNNAVDLFRCDAGIFTSLATWSGISSGDVLHLQVSGSDFTAVRNGTPLFGSVTDATYAGGQAGLNVFSGSVDTWSAGPMALVDTAGTASGTGAAAAVGLVARSGAGAATGTGTAGSTGRSIIQGLGAAGGQGGAAAAGVGIAITAHGVGVASAVGACTAASTAAASGAGNAHGVFFTVTTSSIHMQAWEPVTRLKVG